MRPILKWPQISRAVIASVVFSAMAWASPPGLAGNWLTPYGSVVRVQRCAEAVCLTLIKVAANVPVSTDKLNPDPALRRRPLCGLQIGDGFVLQGETAATGGKLYDPQSGKTYSGKISLDGDTLKLRGYIGISLFGRSETWTRTGSVEACK